MSPSASKCRDIMISLVCAALALCSIGVAAADPLFPGVTSDLGPLPNAVAVGDVNGDGRLDLVTTDGLSGEINVILSRGDGTFLSKVSLAGGYNSRSVALADFTADGKLDLAIPLVGAFRVLAGDGTGHFFPFINVPPPSPLASANSLAVADFNADDLPDVVVVYTSLSVVDVYMSRNIGGWQRQRIPVRLPLGVVAADFNHDGMPDIATQSPCATGDSICTRGEVAVLLNMGSETFAPAVLHATGSTPIGLISGDFNGDGHPDLAVGNQFFSSSVESGASVLFGDGNGGFAARIGFAGITPSNIAAGDFNGDAIDDIALQGSDRFTVLLGRPDGLLREGAPNATGDWPINLAVGDFNDDGRQDVAVTHRSASLGYEPGYAAVYPGRGDGTFSSGMLPTAEYPVDVTTADLNEDGLPDLIAVITANSGISIHLNQGARSFASAVNLPGVTYPTDAVSADFNADGHADLAVCNGGSGGGSDDVTIFLGDGTGTLAVGTRPSVGSQPNSIAAGDFNGDHAVDLVVANAVDLSLLLGRGDGTFLPESRLNAGLVPRHPVIADLDGDGHPDIAVTNPTGADWGVSILAGLGDGTFAPPRRIPTTYIPYLLAAGDVNRDGIPDLTAVSTSPEAVLVLLGVGGGDFLPVFPSPFVGAPASMALGDLDADGSADLAVAINSTERRSGGVLFLQGNGSGAFTDGGHFVAGRWPSSVTAADLDGDGRPDLAVSTIDTNAIELLFNRGRGPDADADGIPDSGDPCTDTDGDGFGDPGFPANTCPADNCRDVPNPGQENGDRDPFGDACDRCTDSDRDGRGDPGYPGNACAPDNCPATFNPYQADNDGDGVGIACDTCNDPDHDGFGSPFPILPTSCGIDNCRTVFNPGQEDADGDGVGDACDPCPRDADNDRDGDGVCGDVDNCPKFYNSGQDDQDGDRVGDACDNCPTASNPDQADTNHDGAGDACQPTVRIYAIRQDGGAELEVFATAADPQGEQVHGTIEIIESRTSHYDLPDLGATFDCAAGIFPQDIPGEGIGFINGSVGIPLLFDFPTGASFFGLTCGAPILTYFLAPGSCDVAVEFNTVLQLDQLSLPASICVLKGGYGGPRFDATVLGYDASHISIDFHGRRTLALPFAGSLPGAIDISSLRPDADHLLRITATDGVTPPVSAEAPFLYQSELAMTFGPPVTTVSGILMSFTSAAGKGSGILKWTTDAEFDLRGFNVIDRDPRGRRVQLNPVIIPCEECITGAGRTYTFLIPKHKSGRNAFIEVVHADGRIDTFGQSRRE